PGSVFDLSLGLGGGFAGYRGYGGFGRGFGFGGSRLVGTNAVAARARDDARRGAGAARGHRRRRHVGDGDVVRARVQALQVARQRADFLVGQLVGDGRHDVEQVRLALGGGTRAVLLKPALGVGRLL